MATFREESEDPKDWASEIMMDSHLSILVEGDGDELLYEKFFDEDVCQIEVMNGKEKLLEVLSLINAQNSKAAIAIIDADLDRITGAYKKYPNNIFLADKHDADTMTFLSEAYFRVAKEYFSKTKVSKKEDLATVRDVIIQIEIPLALLRVYDKEKGTHFAFKPNSDGDKPFPYGGFIESNKNTLSYKGDKDLIRCACSYNGDQGRGMDRNEIQNGLVEIGKRRYSLDQILHGHDLMHIMALSLKRYGKTNKMKNSNEDLETSFRLAYSMGEFLNTDLYASLELYARTNTIYFLKGMDVLAES